MIMILKWFDEIYYLSYKKCRQDVLRKQEKIGLYYQIRKLSSYN